MFPVTIYGQTLDVGDWVIFDFEINCILSIVKQKGGVRVTEVSDGIGRTMGFDLSVQPLTLENKVIADIFKYYYDKILLIDNKTRNLNIPTLHSYFSLRCVEAMTQKKEQKKIIDEICDLVMKITNDKIPDEFKK